MSDAMAAEFDTVSEWTAQVARRLGRDYLPARGVPGQRQPGRLGLADQRSRAAAR